MQNIVIRLVDSGDCFSFEEKELRFELELSTGLMLNGNVAERHQHVLQESNEIAASAVLNSSNPMMWVTDYESLQHC